MVARVRQEDNIACQMEGDEWSSYVGCRRIGFSQLLDGRDMPNSHLCDQCDPDSAFMCEIERLIVDPLPSTIVRAPDPVTRGNAEPDFDLFALDLMAIDVSELDQIPAHTQHPARSVTLPPPGPSHLLPPSVVEPAIAILRDTSYYHLMLKTKKKKSWLFRHWFICCSVNVLFAGLTRTKLSLNMKTFGLGANRPAHTFHIWSGGKHSRKKFDSQRSINIATSANCLRQHPICRPATPTLNRATEGTRPAHWKTLSFCWFGLFVTTIQAGGHAPARPLSTCQSTLVRTTLHGGFKELSRMIYFTMS